MSDPAAEARGPLTVFDLLLVTEDRAREQGNDLLADLLHDVRELGPQHFLRRDRARSVPSAPPRFADAARMILRSMGIEVDRIEATRDAHTGDDVLVTLQLGRWFRQVRMEGRALLLSEPGDLWRTFARIVGEAGRELVMSHVEDGLRYVPPLEPMWPIPP